MSSVHRQHGIEMAQLRNNLLNGVELSGIAIGERAEKDSVDERKNGGLCADS